MKTKNIFLAFVSLLFFHCLYSQQRSVLTGKVTDAGTEEPLARASIIIHDANTGTITNDSGFYKTAPIAPGKYLVEVSYTGHESIVEAIEINGPTEKNFSLALSIVEEAGVTITGVSATTRLKQLPQPVDVMKRNELLKISSSNIINSITHIPGVNAVTTGSAVSKPFIRGLGYNRVVTINDGVRQEGQQWGDEHGIEIDDYSVQRIEVLKGPASLIYGSDALAGVINILSLNPVPEGIIKANLLSEYQTNNRLRGFYGGIGGTKNGFSFNAYGSYKGASDYENKYDGPVFNSKFYNSAFGGMLGYRGTWGYSNLDVTNFDQRLGIVEGERDDITGQFIKPIAGGGDAIATEEDFKKIKPLIPFQHIRHFKINSENRFNINRNSLDLVLGFQRNQRQEFADPDDVNIPEVWFDLKTVNYAFKFNFPYKDNWRTSIGISGMVQTNKNRAEEALIPNYNLLDAGGFVFTQYQKDKLTLSGGLRFDNRHINSKELMEGPDIKFEAFTKNFSNVSGSAGVSYEPQKEITLKLNIARGFRSPNLAELASNGAHEGTFRYEIGDVSLKSETSFQVDVGFETNTEHITMSAGAFYNNINNFIFYRKVLNSAGGDSIIIDPGTGDNLTVFKFTSEDARLAGFEFNMDIHPHPLDWLHFENTLSFTNARFKNMIDGSQNVPLIPAARYIAELRGNFLPKGKTFRNVYLSFESDYTFKQNKPFTGYNTETATGSYWLVNASAGTDIVSKGKTVFSIHLSGMNLGEVAYQNHLSRLKYAATNNATGREGVFNVGRNFGIKINVPLDFEWK